MMKRATWANLRHGLQLVRLDPAGAYDRLASAPTGLSVGEAARRLAEFGPNRLEAGAVTPIWRLFAREFVHVFALLLWCAAALAFIAGHLDAAPEMHTLGWAIIGVILVNGSFSFWQVYRAERALAALRRLLPQRVQVVREGKLMTLDAETLVPGDLISLAAGDRVPADCRIVEAWGLRVSLAPLTGESMPKSRSADADASDDPLSARNLLFAGSEILAGECRALVFATGMLTEFGHLAHLTVTAGETESPLTREIRRISRFIGFFALALGVIFFLVGQLIGLSFWANMMFAIGIIVANVPEGLLPTVTLALAMATQRMAKRRALVRHLPAVEALGSVTVILTDKTGTLTENRLTVRELFVSDRHALASPHWPVPLQEDLAAVARHCHSLRFDDTGKADGDPLEIALWQHFGAAEQEPRCGEMPFDAERRRMSVITQGKDGERHLWCKGAPEAVLPLCREWLAEDGPHPFDAAARARFLAVQNDMADRGLRVLALARRIFDAGESPVEDGLTLLGLVGFHDPPRPEVAEAVAQCHSAGIRVIMITGDHPHTALAVAREVGLVQGEAPRIVLGEELRRMSAAELMLALASPEILFARVSAAQKMQVVEALQKRGEIVAVTGDGVNDAPALKTADVGIAMGKNGTDVAREAADIVLLDDHFATIVAAIEEGRAVFENIRKFLTYILSSNIPEIVPYLAFVLGRIPLPLTVVQILAVDLGTDMLPALALGAEPPHPGVMQRPPRPRSERLLSWSLVARAYLFLGPLEALAAMAAFFFVLDRGGWQAGMVLPTDAPLYAMATTATLAAIVVMQMANLFVCRDPLLPAWRFSLTANPWLLIGLASELALLGALVYAEWAQKWFGTAALPLDVWLFLLPFPFVLFAAEEGRKALVRQGRR